MFFRSMCSDSILSRASFTAMGSPVASVPHHHCVTLSAGGTTTPGACMREALRSSLIHDSQLEEWEVFSVNDSVSPRPQ